MRTFKIPDMRHLKRLGVLASLSLTVLVTNVFSQSGRRNKPSVPTATIAEDATATNPSGRELSERVTLLVGHQFTSRRMKSEEAILQNFVKQLNEFRNVSATAIGDLNSEQARKRAKQETEATVLLLQFDADSFQKGTYILNSPDMDVDVHTFAAVTGQQKFKGKVYYKAQAGPNVRRDNWPGGTPIKITAEAVGVEAAEQVHDWLLLEELRKKKP
ncbi:MAG TPA: hypothetical protein VL866_14745 [Pyrinomonadaceae bacterium]|nr:hypothetical protein [Pyrinomonadaceae bacterium]